MLSSPQSNALFNNASLGIVIVNGKGEIVTLNPYALSLLGYAVEELTGKPVEVLVPNHLAYKHKEYRRLAHDKPVRRPMGIGLDLFAVRKDGSQFPVEISLAKYQDKDEDNVIAFISDITVRKNAETQIKKLNDELEATVDKRTGDLQEALKQLEMALEKEKELGELKSRFVSMASHEFRTPLSTILSSSYLIAKYINAEDQGKRQKHIDRIVSSVTMLTDILNDFLSVGRIEEGRIQVRDARVNIPEAITALSEEMKNNLKKDQAISYHHEGIKEVEIDASLLKHIVMNLISNASKFSPEKSVIEIRSVSREGYMALSVKDHGMGISKSDQKHLMERFFRGANAGHIQGTGLGLHIVSKYAELLHGKVECKSELEKGTEFIITFRTKNMLT
jgi:PAS domain S-box-containing protein